MNFTSRSPEKTQRLGEELGRLAQPGDVFLLTGKLGTGKTCLTQGIAWGLGIEGYATSPTFVLVNEYRGRLPMYHVDLYRLDSVAEVTDLGLDDYLYGKGLCVVEWADKTQDVLPPQNLSIRIDFIDDTDRRLELKPHGERYAELISQIKQGIK